MIKIKINFLDEAAKWRSISDPKVKTEWQPEEIEEISKKYPDDSLFIHFDDGINMDGDEYTDYKGRDSKRPYRTIKDKKGKEIRRVPARFQPQFSFNPQTQYHTPIGIYCYPWAYAKDKIFATTLPFAQDKQFLYIFLAKNPDKILKFKDAESLGVLEKTIFITINKHKKGLKQVKAALARSAIQNHETIEKILNLFFVKKDSNGASLNPYNDMNNLMFDYYKSLLETKYSKDEMTEDVIKSIKKIVDIFEKNFTSFFNEKYITSSGKYMLDCTNKQKVDVFIGDFLRPPNTSALATDDEVKIFYTLRRLLEEEIITGSPSLKTLGQKAVEIQERAWGGDSNPVTEIPTHEVFMSAVEGENYPKLWFYYVNNIFERDQSKVTYFLQNDLEIQILSDSEDQGIIHTAEKTQAIIFNPAFASVLGVKRNPSPSRTKTMDKPEELLAHKKYLNKLKQDPDYVKLTDEEKKLKLGSTISNDWNNGDLGQDPDNIIKDLYESGNDTLRGALYEFLTGYSSVFRNRYPNLPQDLKKDILSYKPNIEEKDFEFVSEILTKYNFDASETMNQIVTYNFKGKTNKEKDKIISKINNVFHDIFFYNKEEKIDKLLSDIQNSKYSTQNISFIHQYLFFNNNNYVELAEPDTIYSLLSKLEKLSPNYFLSFFTGIFGQSDADEAIDKYVKYIFTRYLSDNNFKKNEAVLNYLKETYFDNYPLREERFLNSLEEGDPKSFKKNLQMMQYTEEQIKRITNDYSNNEKSLNEQKLFIYDKDKKIFKLLR